MKYVYITGLVLSLLGGIYLGYRLSPGQPIRELVVGPTVEKEVTRTVTRTEPGKTTIVTEVKERVVTRPTDSRQQAPKASQYSVGIAFRPSQAELSEARVSVGRRLVGNLWGEAAYDIKRKEVTLGLNYEF